MIVAVGVQRVAGERPRERLPVGTEERAADHRDERLQDEGQLTRGLLVGAVAHAGRGEPRSAGQDPQAGSGRQLEGEATRGVRDDRAGGSGVAPRFDLRSGQGPRRSEHPPAKDRVGLQHQTHPSSRALDEDPGRAGTLAGGAHLPRTGREQLEAEACALDRGLDRGPARGSGGDPGLSATGGEVEDLALEQRRRARGGGRGGRCGDGPRAAGRREPGEAPLYRSAEGDPRSSGRRQPGRRGLVRDPEAGADEGAEDDRDQERPEGRADSQQKRGRGRGRGRRYHSFHQGLVTSNGWGALVPSGVSTVIGAEPLESQGTQE